MADQNLSLGTLFTAELSNLLSGVKKIRSELNSLATSYQQFSKQASSQSNQIKATNQLAQSQQSATAAAKQHAGAQQVLGKQIGQVTGFMNRLQSSLKVVASYTITGSLVVGLLKGLESGVSELVNFDQALKNLQAITGATDAQVLGMGQTIKEVARTTKFSAKEVADGMTLLGQAGFTAEESMNAIKATATLATGTMSGFQETVDLLSTTVRAFGLNAIEAGRVADVMANAMNKSKLDIDKLRTAFNYAGASSAEAGLTLEQTAASMMVLADRGLRASTIGTGLRRVLSEMVQPGKDLREILEANGIALEQLQPGVVGYENAMKLLTRVLWDNEKQTINMTKAYKLFELRGAQAAAILVRAFKTGSFDEAQKSLFDVGSAAAMAAIQQEGLGIKFQKLANQAKLVAIAIGEAGVTGVMHGLVDALRGAATSMESFVSSTLGEFVVKFALIGGSIAAVVIGMKMLAGTGLVAVGMALVNVISATNVASAAFNLLLKPIAAMMGPIGWIVVGLGGLIALLVTLDNKNRKAAESATRMSQELSKTANGVSLYGDLLEALNKSQDSNALEQYRATVKRVAEEYKHLGSETELLALKHEDLMKILRENAFEAYANSLKSAIEALRRFTAEPAMGFFERASRAIAKMNAESSSMQDLTDDNRSVEKERQIASTQKTLINMLREGIETKKITVEQAEEHIRTLVSENLMTQALADQGIAALKKALEGLNQVGGDTVEALKMVKEMPAGLQRIFDSLNIKDKVEFLEKYRAVLQKIKSDTKVAQSAGLDVGQLEKQRLAEFEATFKTNQEVRSLKGSFLELFNTLNAPDKLKFLSMWEKYGSDIENVRKSFKGLGNEAAANENIRLITEEFQRQIDVVFEAKALTGELLGLYNQLSSKEKAEFLEKLVSHASEIQRVTELMGKFEQTRDPEVIEANTKAMNEEFNKMMQIEFGVMDLRKQFGEFYNTLTALEKVEFAREFTSFNKTLNDTGRMLSKTGMAADDVKESLKDLQDHFVDRALKIIVDRESVKEIRAQIQELYDNDHKLELFSDLKGLESELTAARDLMHDMGFKDGPEIEMVVERIKQKFLVMRTASPWEAMQQGAKDFTYELGTSAKIWYDSAKSALGGIQGGFSELFGDAARGKLQSFSTYFTKFCDSLVDAWADAMAKMVMKAAGESDIGKGVGGILSSLFGTGNAAGSGMNASGYGPQRAEGGPVWKGQPYIVGERRPEVFVPSEDGRIIPSLEKYMKAAGSGGASEPVQVIVNNNSGSKASVRQQSSPGGMRQIFVTIGNDILSGGPTDQAMRQRYGLQPVPR